MFRPVERFSVRIRQPGELAVAQRRDGEGPAVRLLVAACWLMATGLLAHAGWLCLAFGRG